MISDTSKEKSQVPKIPFGVLLFFIISVGISSNFFLWETANHASYQTYLGFFIATIFFFLFISLNLAELLSLIQYTGGSFPIVRIAISPMWGFIVSGYEWLQLVLYLTLILLNAARVLDEFRLNIDGSVVWIIFLFIITVLNFLPISFMSNFVFIFSVTSAIIWLIYIFGCSQYLTAGDDIPNHNSFEEEDLISVGSILTYFFAITLSPSYNRIIDKPKKTTPYIVIGSYICFSFISLFTYHWLTFSYPIGEIKSKVSSPLMFGLGKLFNVSYHRIVIISFVPLFNLFANYFYLMNVQTTHLGNSGFLPKIFSGEVTSKASILLNVLLIYIIVHLDFFIKNYFDLIRTLFSFFTFLTFFIQMFCCLRFKQRYSSLKREYYSPLGVYGCYAAILVSFFSGLWIIYYSKFVIHIITLFFSFTIIQGLIYMGYSKDRQTFSEEEQKAMFAVYVINANLLKAKRKKLTLSNKNNSELEVSNTYFSHLTNKATYIFQFLSNPFQEKLSFEDDIKRNNEFLSNNSNSNTNTNNGATTTFNDKSIPAENFITATDEDIEKNSIERFKEIDEPVVEQIENESTTDINNQSSKSQHKIFLFNKDAQVFP